jgi:hypothetical protein
MHRAIVRGLLTGRHEERNVEIREPRMLAKAAGQCSLRNAKPYGDGCAFQIELFSARATTPLAGNPSRISSLRSTEFLMARPKTFLPLFLPGLPQ